MSHEYLVQGALALTRGSVLRIEDGSDLLVYVWEGSLWLTQEGDRRDYHVGAGRWFRLDRNGVVLAHALERCSLTLTAPQPSHYARSIALQRAGSTVQQELYSGVGDRSSFGARLRRFWSGLFAPYARPTTAAL